MKAIEWDGANGRNRQVLTGRIITSPTLPGGLEDGDLWIDTSGVPVLKGKVAGTVYDIITEGDGEWQLYLDTYADELNALTYAETLTDVVASAYVPTTDFMDTVPTVVTGFSPLNISGIAFWYDASDTASITHTANAVTQWQDKSGNARHLSDADAGERPTTNVTTRNGLNVITFDGGDWLTHDAGSDVVDISPGTIFVVAMDDNSTQSATTYRKIFSARRSSTATSDYQAPNFQLPKSNTSRQMYYTANGNHAIGFYYNTNDYFIDTLQYSASGTSNQYNTATPVTNGLNGDVALMRYLRVGSRCGTGTPPNVSSFPDESWVGPIAEIIAYNSALNAGEIAAIQSYLADKWWDTAEASPFNVSWTDAYWADDPDWTNPGNGNVVTSWRDGGSGARNATPSIGGSLITFSSSVAALNNRGGIVFAGTGDAALETSAFSISEPYSLVTVCVRNGTAHHGQEENIVSLGDNDQGIYSRPVNGRWSLRAGGTPMTTGPTYTTGAGAAIRGHLTSSQATISVNGTVVSGAGNTETWSSGLGIGGSPNPDGWFPANATIAFVGYFVGDVTADPNWGAFVDWVASYYGLTMT